MNIRISWLVLAWMLSLSGCIYDDMSDCETRAGLIIHFTCLNDKGVDEFDSRIDQVDLYVFDEGGYYLSNHTYNARKLSEFQGAIDLQLPAGTYHIIAWGNVYGNDILPSLTEEMMIHSARIAYSETAVGSDNLYYAPRKTTTSMQDMQVYEVVVREKETTEVTIDFMTAYYTLNVYVQGFRDYIGSHNQNPFIEVSSLPESYDFHLGLGAYTRSFSRISQSVEENGKNYAHAAFQTRYIENQNPVRIQVVRSTNQEIAHVVNLQEILLANNYQLRIGEYAEINVYIEFFSDGHVEVTMEITGWKNTGVSPGI